MISKWRGRGDNMWKRSLEGLMILAVFMSFFVGHASAQDITISSNTTWDEGTYTYTNVTVNNGATLTIAGGSTLNVTGILAVTGDSSTILLQGKNRDGLVGGQWAGVGVTINAGHVQIDSGSRISADGQGYTTNQGPGGSTTAGGSYGGKGSGYGAGPTYGSVSFRVDLRSGGQCCAHGHPGWSKAGGAIKLNVGTTLTLNGEITANGAYGYNHGSGGWGRRRCRDRRDREQDHCPLA